MDASLLPARQIDSSDDLADAKGNRFPQSCKPPAAADVVKRIFTDLAVMDVAPSRLSAVEMIPGMTVEELPTVTEAAPRTWAAWA